MCAVVLLSVSCGKQHDAENLVEDFMENNITEASSITDMDFNDIDSTTHINDSIVTVMRTWAKTNAKQYRQDIDYPSTKAGSCLIMVRVTYKIKEKQYQDTYYLDQRLTNIVAFKSTEIQP